MRGLGGLIGGAALLCACATETPPTCDEPPARAPLTAPDRHLLGEAQPLPRDLAIAEREEELRGSMAARRRLGWAIAERVLSPVEVEGAGGRLFEVPRFATWYDREDLRRVHRHFDPGAPMTDEAFDAAFAWNRDAVLEMEAWPADRLAAYLDAVDTEERAQGLGGVSRTLYGPAVARHLLSSEAELLGCRERDFDLLDADPEGLSPRTERIALAGCEARTLGPYLIPEGGTLTARTSGEVALAIDDQRCGGPSCTMELAGPARVTIEAFTTGVDPAEVEVTWDDADALFVPCLASEVPEGAAVVKADYRRAELGVEVDVHDTSAGSLVALREGDEDWASARTGTADPGPEDIYTVVLDGGERYRLVALHVMVKELGHWVWATLSWSPEPDAGLGADRPAAIDGPFAHYAMCVVTDFVDDDPAPDAAASDPSLAAVLRATHEGAGASSWCSNPYLEEGAGNAVTNCVGCHQHAGSSLTSEEILADEARFPHRGRSLVRTNFPTDYLFSAPVLAEIFLEP